MITDSGTDPSTLAKTGETAPCFEYHSLGSSELSLFPFPGSVNVLCFFTTWCPGCLKELPSLQKEIWGQFSARQDFHMLAIAREQNEDTLKEYIAENNLSMPFAVDADRKIFDLYANKYIPRFILVGKDGRIILQNRGYSESELKELSRCISACVNS